LCEEMGSSWSFGSFGFLHVSCCALWVVTFNLLVSKCMLEASSFPPGYIYIYIYIFSLSLSLSLYYWTFGLLYIPAGYTSHICMPYLKGHSPFFFSFLGGEFWANNRERERERERGEFLINFF
jgi:hypothetical protein